MLGGLAGLLVAVGFTGLMAQDNDYLAGSASLLKGEYAKAVESLSYAINRNNADDRLFLKRGEALLKLTDYERARNDFEEANTIRPGVADLWLARCSALAGAEGEAVSYLTRHLQSEFRLPEDSIKKDKAFDALQTSPEWYTLWQKDWYTEAEKEMAEVRFYSRKSLFDDAHAHLADALAEHPDNPELYLLKGKLSFDQGNYAAAVADYSTALELDRNNIPVYARRGMAYYYAGRYKDAVNDFTRALRDDPAGFDLYRQRAKAYAGAGSWELAVRDMQFYLNYFEGDQRAQFLCGEYCYEAGDYINALKYFNRILKEDPVNSAYFKWRGKTYFRTATYRYAGSDLAMSLDLNPDDAEAWMYLGLVKIQTGNRETGCSDLQRAQRMGNTESVKYILEYCR